MSQKYYLTHKLKHVLDEKLSTLSKKEQAALTHSVIEELKFLKQRLNRYKKGERADAVHSILDMTLQSTLERHRFVPICKKGCDYCCHVHIECSREEAAAIFQYVKANNIEIDWERAKLQTSVDKANRSKSLEECAKTEEDFLKIPYEQRACLFLKDGVCQVYSVRPCRCRAHISAEDSSEPCRTDQGKFGMLKMVVEKSVEMIISAYDAVNPGGSLPMFLLEFRDKESRNEDKTCD